MKYTNYVLLALVLILAGILVFQKPDDSNNIQQERDAALRARDSIASAHRQTLHEYEALIIHYRRSKAGQELAEQRARQSQDRLNAALRTKPQVYTDSEIDSILNKWYPE